MAFPLFRKLSLGTRKALHVLLQCYHPHIVILKDVIRVPSHLGLVLEYVPGGTLFDLVDKRRGIPEAQVCSAFED